MKMRIAILLAAGLGAAGLAQAQSHSVENYSNPPGKQADAKAGTQATPGQTATADQQDARHPAKGAKDAAANKGKPGKSAKSAKASADKASGSSGAAGSSGSSDAPASKNGSQSATAPVTMDGASKGGDEATMQYEPSQRETGNVEQHAFDNGAVPAGSKSGIKK